MLGLTCNLPIELIFYSNNRRWSTSSLSDGSVYSLVYFCLCGNHELRRMKWFMNASTKCTVRDDGFALALHCGVRQNFHIPSDVRYRRVGGPIPRCLAAFILSDSVYISSCGRPKICFASSQSHTHAHSLHEPPHFLVNLTLVSS